VDRASVADASLGGASQNADRILVVDDDPEIQSLVGAVLELAGYQIEIAANGAAALRAIERVAPALMLLDVNMPFLDGRELALELEDRGIEVPIIIMTAGDEAGQTAADLKAVGYLPKPFDLSDLLDLVERHCRARHLKGHWWQVWRRPAPLAPQAGGGPVEAAKPARNSKL
jgi:DNA-binding response OmpR family regulator